ncbi:MAG: Na+/H+ antiporter NhaA, partial [Alphaproteobacteria bacterium]
LKAFLLAVAVIDDLGAIMIIALFYTGALNVTALAAAAVCIVILAVMNARGVDRLPAYLVVAFVLWICMWKSGASATLAGVIAALFVPMKSLDGSRSPLHDLAHALKLPVLFGIMPIFAFANAGVPLYGLGLGDLVKPVTLGIAAGLFLGKPIGITLATFATVKSGLGRLPEGATWLQVLGVAWIAGIGFTMSLFIGTLAFPGDDMQNQVRLGVMLGSLLSTTAGVLVLNAARSRRAGA